MNKHRALVFGFDLDFIKALPIEEPNNELDDIEQDADDIRARITSDRRKHRSARQYRLSK